MAMASASSVSAAPLLCRPEVAERLKKSPVVRVKQTS
jgi:hypothetical protein